MTKSRSLSLITLIILSSLLILFEAANPGVVKAGDPTIKAFLEIPTNGPLDWEFFGMDGEQYLAAANYQVSGNFNIDSVIYKRDNGQFVPVEAIPTHGATDWEHFKITGEHYLVLANSNDGSNTNIDSVVYRWDAVNSEFVQVQTIPTQGATDWEYFYMNNRIHLAVANSGDGSTTNIDSIIYYWNGPQSQFVQFQAIPTQGATNWEHFSIDDQHYLAVANGSDDSDPNIPSIIYRWDDSQSQFVEFQAIDTQGAADWEYFSITDQHYLAVANHRNGNSYNTTSKIYRWNGSQFVEFQAIDTQGAADWTYFTDCDSLDQQICGYYLAVANSAANSVDNPDYDINSKVYHWDGSQFTEFQVFPTQGIRDWEHFISGPAGNTHYLAAANAQDNAGLGNPDSVVYRLTPPLLAIYALAFDNKPTSTMNLAVYYEDTIAEIQAATQGALEKTALVLADLDRSGDTHILEIKDGQITSLDGLPDAQGNLNTAFKEYDMTDGETLGGFLLWARQNYPAAKTIFTYAGHGAPVVPETDINNIFGDDSQLSALQDQIIVLPSRRGGGADLTDHHTGDSDTTVGLLSIVDFGQALAIGSQNGQDKFTTVDMVTCFAGTIENYYQAAPYAETMTASPNYTYFDPPLLGQALAKLESTREADVLAGRIIQEYDKVLPNSDHPRLLTAVRSADIPAIKAGWDRIATALGEDFDAGKLHRAYQASPLYDTTYCRPQDWALNAPDELVDLAVFAGNLGQQYAGNPIIAQEGEAIKNQVEQAIIDKKTRDGAPWFAADPQPWPFSGQGIALYAPLFEPGQGQTTWLSWQYGWYTNQDHPLNPQPFAFIQPDGGDQTWSDIVRAYWQGTHLETVVCLPTFPPVLHEGEVWVETIISPQGKNSTRQSAITPTATIGTDQLALNPLVRFEIVQDGAVVFSNTVGAGRLEAGVHRVEASETWRPTAALSATLTIQVDTDNRISPEDETNNIATKDIFFANPRLSNIIHLPFVMRSSFDSKK